MIKSIPPLAGGSIMLYKSHFGNEYSGSSGKLESTYHKIQQFHEYVYSKMFEHSYNKDMCSSLFIASLFVIAGTWIQPRCPSTEEWIEKMWFIYTMDYYSSEKQWNLKIHRQMDGSRTKHPD